MNATGELSGVTSARMVPTYEKVPFLLQSDCKFWNAPWRRFVAKVEKARLDSSDSIQNDASHGA